MLALPGGRAHVGGARIRVVAVGTSSANAVHADVLERAAVSVVARDAQRRVRAPHAGFTVDIGAWVAVVAARRCAGHTAEEGAGFGAIARIRVVARHVVGRALAPHAGGAVIDRAGHAVIARGGLAGHAAGRRLAGFQAVTGIPVVAIVLGNGRVRARTIAHVNGPLGGLAWARIVTVVRCSGAGLGGVAGVAERLNAAVVAGGTHVGGVGARAVAQVNGAGRRLACPGRVAVVRDPHALLLLGARVRPGRGLLIVAGASEIGRVRASALTVADRPLDGFARAGRRAFVGRAHALLLVCALVVLSRRVAVVTGRADRGRIDAAGFDRVADRALGRLAWPGALARHRVADTGAGDARLVECAHVAVLAGATVRAIHQRAAIQGIADVQPAGDAGREAVLVGGRIVRTQRRRLPRASEQLEPRDSHGGRPPKDPGDEPELLRECAAIDGLGYQRHPPGRPRQRQQVRHPAQGQRILEPFGQQHGLGHRPRFADPLDSRLQGRLLRVRRQRDHDSIHRPRRDVLRRRQPHEERPRCRLLHFERHGQLEVHVRRRGLQSGEDVQVDGRRQFERPGLVARRGRNHRARLRRRPAVRRRPVLQQRDPDALQWGVGLGVHLRVFNGDLGPFFVRRRGVDVRLDHFGPHFGVGRRGPRRRSPGRHAHPVLFVAHAPVGAVRVGAADEPLRVDTEILAAAEDGQGDPHRSPPRFQKVPPIHTPERWMPTEGGSDDDSGSLTSHQTSPPTMAAPPADSSATPMVASRSPRDWADSASAMVIEVIAPCSSRSASRTRSR